MSALDTIQENPISAVLRCLEAGSPQQEEFLAGLDQRVRAIELDQSDASSAALLSYVHEWTISLLAQKQGSWRKQIEASERAIERGELDSPMSAEGLRAAITR
jgi:hypothetical protein